MQYHIKRGDNLFGPYSLDQVRKLAESQKLTGSDLISNNQQGPFQPIQGFLQQFESGAAPALAQMAAASTPAQDLGAAVPTQQSQAIGTAFQYQTNYSKHEKQEEKGIDTKKTLWIVGGSLGGIVSLIILFFLFRTILTMGNEIKEEKEAERAAALAREVSPEARDKRRQFVEGIVNAAQALTGQSNTNSSASSNSGKTNYSGGGSRNSSGGSSGNRRPVLTENEIIKRIVAKFINDDQIFRAYKSERDNGQTRGNLKLKDVPNALAQLQDYSLKDNYSHQDAIAIARLIKEIDFARKRGI